MARAIGRRSTICKNRYRATSVASTVGDTPACPHSFFFVTRLLHIEKFHLHRDWRKRYSQSRHGVSRLHRGFAGSRTVRLRCRQLEGEVYVPGVIQLTRADRPLKLHGLGFYLVYVLAPGICNSGRNFRWLRKIPQSAIFYWNQESDLLAHFWSSNRNNVAVSAHCAVLSVEARTSQTNYHLTHPLVEENFS